MSKRDDYRDNTDWHQVTDAYTEMEWRRDRDLADLMMPTTYEPTIRRHGRIVHKGRT